MGNYYERYHDDDEFTSGETDDNISQLCEPLSSILSIEDYKELINSEQPGVLDYQNLCRHCVALYLLLTQSGT